MKMKFLKVKFNFPFKCLSYVNIGQFQPHIIMGSHSCVRRYCFLPKATTLESCVVESCSVNPCNPEPRVVIIGAGMAGLSAAQRLVQCGIHNFIVLEATERPGGRIHSYWLGDVVAELGAQWINGACLQNSMYTLASQANLLNQPLHRLDLTRGMFCTSEGRTLAAPVTNTAYHTFRQIEQQAANIYKDGCCEQYGSLQNFISVRMQQELKNFPEYQRYDAAYVMYGLSHELRNKFGEDLSLVSADQFGSYIDMPGGSIRVPLGYLTVVEPLLRQIPASAIHFSKPANIIRWGKTGSGRVQVQCCDGEVFSADYVIVTFSLGCLKCHADQLFCPVLPAIKREAIDALGFGTSNKIYLEYSEPFWISGEGNLKLAWTAEEMRHFGTKGEWICGVTAVEEVSSQVVCVSVSGEQAVQMETLSEEDVAEGITKLIRKFTGNPCLPYPVALLRSMWASNPHFCGASSYLGCGSCVAHQHDLSLPLPISSSTPWVLFAGEATVPGYFGTTHGARISGIREADRILQLTNEFQGPPRR